jgi:hypothetical protein
MRSSNSIHKLYQESKRIFLFGNAMNKPVMIYMIDVNKQPTYITNFYNYLWSLLKNTKYLMNIEQ